MKTLQTISKWCLLMALGITVSSLTIATTHAAPAAKIRVLLVTGDDVEPAHNWAEVSQAIRDVLVQTERFEVRIVEDSGIFDSAATLARYDVVFMQMYNAKTPTLSAQGKENLVNYVKGGKGFVVSHLSSASFKEWDEFKKLCGRYWVMGTSGHGPRSVFKCNVVKSDNAITQGVTDFEADDELYAKLQGDAPITVLVQADSDWSKKTEPLAFTLEYGQGRVFHQAFGHDVKAVKNPAVAKIIARGTEWAATGKVK